MRADIIVKFMWDYVRSFVKKPPPMFFTINSNKFLFFSCNNKCVTKYVFLFIIIFLSQVNLCGNVTSDIHFGEWIEAIQDMIAESLWTYSHTLQWFHTVTVVWTVDHFYISRTYWKPRWFPPLNVEISKMSMFPGGAWRVSALQDATQSTTNQQSQPF